MKWVYNSAAWKRLRAAHLAIEPTCRACDEAGRLTRADTVDHIVPMSEGGPALPDHDGLASYCAACHSAKTARGAEAGAVRTTRPVMPRKGCDVDGWPLDPSHHWNKSLRADDAKTAPTINSQLVSKSN